MNEPVKSYRELRIWQKAMDLVPKVYEQVKKLPKEETYALGDQIRRSAVSIPANIAEGHARQHTKEFIQHLSIAKGSLAELDTLLELGQRLGYLNQLGLSEINRAIVDLRMPLQGLINKLRAKL
ncbi:MAG: four helix bundle protein [Acidobacteria bacterium]|nr:MAG: four helix bundle protein [Acidobacteriota bacterium]